MNLPLNRNGDVNDWDDLRFFLAASRGGSFSAAARTLNVSQPTVSRRVAQLEEALEARLFEHRRGRLELTESGRQVIDLAESIEETTHRLRRRVQGTDAQPSGAVAVTTTEGLASRWLAPKLIGFREAYPLINVSLLVGARSYDLLRGEADVALRLGEPGPPDLVGRRVAKAHAGIYASRAYLDRHGTPERVEDLADHLLVEAVGALARYPQCARLNALMAGSPRGGCVDNAYAQLALAESGLGLIAIMSYMAEGYGGLVRLLPEAFDVSIDLWLLTHPDLRNAARVRALIDFLVDEIKTDRHIFQASPE
jgi:molybdate transport repressor ModE-like protein